MANEFASIVQALMAITPPTVTQMGQSASGGGVSLPSAMSGGSMNFRPQRQQQRPAYNPLASVQPGVGQGPAGGAPGMMPPSLARQVAEAQAGMANAANPRTIGERWNYRKNMDQAQQRAGQAAYNLQSWQQGQGQNAALQQQDRVFTAVMGLTGDQKTAKNLAQLYASDPKLADKIIAEIAEKQYTEPTTAMKNAEAMGLRPGTPEYNQYIRATGPKGTNINIDRNISGDYMLQRDENGEVVSMSPIPGSEAWQQQQEAEETSYRAGFMHVSDVEQTLNEAQRAMDNVSDFTTGLLGAATGLVPGTPAFDLRKQFDTLRANTAFKELLEMRQASKTGGALGNVSNREIELLYNSLTALDPDMSREEVERSLNTLMIQNSKVSWMLQNEQWALEQGISPSDFVAMAKEYVDEQYAAKDGSDTMSIKQLEEMYAD